MTIADALDTFLMLIVAANIASAAYVLVAIRKVDEFRRERRASGHFRPPVTVLKPVCGLDVGLYGNLRSFCVQDYPEYQVVFGIPAATDPAVPVVQRLMKEFPLVNISLVIDETVAGPNLKVSNLGNMYRKAMHPYLLIADSDMRVDDQYLSSVMAPFEDAQVGVVTCLYLGTPAGGLPSMLASMFINEWFLPSVLVSAGLSEIRFGLGATIVVRRELLDRIGGFARLAHYVADDHMLGKLISNLGFKVVLSGYVVENVVHESSLESLFRHELRWARTIRTVAPVGHAFSFLMYGVPLAIIGAMTIDAASKWEPFEIAIVALAVFLRGWMHLRVGRKLGLKPGHRSIWLVPLRDILSFLVWGASFFGRKIDWRNMTFTIGPRGLMEARKGFEA